MSYSSIKGPRCFLEQETYTYCFVQVGSRTRFEPAFTIELNKLKALWKIDLDVKKPFR